MAPVYFYVPASEALSLAECGLKLSRWYEKELVIEGFMKKCICAFLNPKDDFEKFRDDSYTCLMLEVSQEYCFAADKSLFDSTGKDREIMEYYISSILSLKDYVYGSYRMPECLITATVIPGQIKLMNKARDIPVLFDNSEELYLNNLTEITREKYRDFTETGLYCYFDRLAARGAMTRIIKEGTGIAVFVEKGSKRAYAIKIPD